MVAGEIELLARGIGADGVEEGLELGVSGFEWLVGMSLRVAGEGGTKEFEGGGVGGDS